MTPDDLLYRFRVCTLTVAEELGNVRTACRAMDIHHSTFYRWRPQARRFGLGILRPRERRQPRMSNSISPLVEQRVVAIALGHPGFGPARISADLARPKCGGFLLSASGVWRVLRRHGLNTRGKRLSLVAGYAAPPEPDPPPPRPERHLQAEPPGALVQFDCFHVGRLSGTKGTVWQYTAINVTSAYTWAELHSTPRNASAKWNSRFACRVASDLSARGWKLEAVITDNGYEFRSRVFGAAVAEFEAGQHFRQAGRPQTNRMRREGAGHDLGGILEASLRQTPDPQTDRAQTRPELLQRRPRPHRSMEPRTNPRMRHQQG